MADLIFIKKRKTKMRTKLFHSLLYIWAVLLCMACQNSYPGMEYDFPENGVDSNHENASVSVIQVTLDESSLFYSSATRGAGIMDPTDGAGFQKKYLDSKFHVLSYRRTVYSNGELSGQSNMGLLLNSPANTDKKDCLVSSELSESEIGSSGHRGKVAVPITMAGELKFLDDETAMKPVDLSYNAKYPNIGYDFFAYYLDDAKINSTTAEQEKITYNITVDGTQDIMAGYAPTLTREYLSTKEPAITEDSLINKILYYGDGGYSALAAKSGIQPRIDIKHLFSALEFFVTKKDDTADISIDKVELMAHTSGDIVVASHNFEEIGFTPTGEKGLMTVTDKKTVLKNNEETVLGNPINVPADYEYVAVITYTQSNLQMNTEGGTYEPVTATIEVPLAMKYDTFKPGVKYKVLLNLYGITGIEVNVSVTAWEEGGDIGLEY